MVSFKSLSFNRFASIYFSLVYPNVRFSGVHSPIVAFFTAVLTALTGSQFLFECIGYLLLH